MLKTLVASFIVSSVGLICDFPSPEQQEDAACGAENESLGGRSILQKQRAPYSLVGASSIIGGFHGADVSGYLHGPQSVLDKTVHARKAQRQKYIDYFRGRFYVLAPVLLSLYLFFVSYISGKGAILSDNKNRSLRQSAARALCYVVFAILLSLWNKFTMVPTAGNFAYPISICALHMLVTSIVVWGMRLAWPSLFSGLIALPLELARPCLLPSLAIGGLSAISMMLLIYSMKYLSVATISMIRASTPAHALVLALLFGTMDSTKSLSHAIIGICLMFGGATITCFTDVSVSILGIFLFILGVVSEQLVLLLLKRLLDGSKFQWDPFSTMAVVYPIGFVCLTILAIVCEGPHLPLKRLWEDRELQLTLLTGALFAVAMNVSYVHLLDVISPVTFTVCGVGKDLVTALLSLLLGESVTPWQVFGYAITLYGVAYYDHAQARQEQQEPLKLQDTISRSENVVGECLIQS